VDVSDSNSVYIRANYLNASVPQTAVGVVLDSTYNVDPRESSSAIDCYMQDSLLMTTPVPCASFPRDAYNNAPLSIPTIELNPINRSNASPLNLFASLTAAVSGNALASSQRDSKYNVILRYRDSSTASEGSNYTSGYCTGKTCVQTTLAAPIIERETKPTIFATIIKQETQIAALNTGTINLDINKTSPIIQVTGSQSFTEGSTIKLNIRVNPFSDLGYSDFTAVHPVGLQSYTVNLESCQYKGSYCPTRLPDNTLSNTPGQAIFLPPNDAAPESDKDRTGNMFTDNQNGHVGEGNFVFYFQPPKGSATFDNGGTSGSTGEYIYTFKIERNPNTSNSPDNITRFQVKLQVQPGS
jgi:hypothetical protein